MNLSVKIHSADEMAEALLMILTYPNTVREPKPDTPTHEGVWKPIAAVLGGIRLPDAAVKAITLKITGEKYEVSVKGKRNQTKARVCSTRARIPSA